MRAPTCVITLYSRYTWRFSLSDLPRQSAQKHCNTNGVGICSTSSRGSISKDIYAHEKFVRVLLLIPFERAAHALHRLQQSAGVERLYRVGRLVPRKAVVQLVQRFAYQLPHISLTIAEPSDALDDRPYGAACVSYPFTCFSCNPSSLPFQLCPPSASGPSEPAPSREPFCLVLIALCSSCPCPCSSCSGRHRFSAFALCNVSSRNSTRWCKLCVKFGAKRK
uniref:Uncharacterized protein n=1 Tax=Anopheles coluzzii TaxID=1518534 RepID=A0A8W7NZL6_ANOCL